MEPERPNVLELKRPNRSGAGATKLFWNRNDQTVLEPERPNVLELKRPNRSEAGATKLFWSRSDRTVLEPKRPNRSGAGATKPFWSRSEKFWMPGARDRNLSFGSTVLVQYCEPCHWLVSAVFLKQVANWSARRMAFPPVFCMQCRISPTLDPPQSLQGPPNGDLWNSYATFRDRMALKTKYPNFRHNFGRTRPVARF